MALFGARFEYALRALADIASAGPGAIVQSGTIVAREGLSEAYLDQILSALRRAGIVRSARGAGGGYSLTRAPAAVNAWHVAEAMGTLQPEPAQDAGGGGLTGVSQAVGDLERSVHQRLAAELASVSIADIVDRAGAHRDAMSVAVGI